MSRKKNQETWFEHIELYRTSGVSQNAYCKEFGLTKSTFQYWLRKHKKSKEILIEDKHFIPLKLDEHRKGSIPNAGFVIKSGQTELQVPASIDIKDLSNLFRSIVC